MGEQETLGSPAPWTVSDIYQGPYVVCAQGYAIAQMVKMPGEFGAERLENAWIMAAGPDLLAACQEFLPILERQLQSVNPGGAAEASKAFQFASARVERMRAAIAKAAPSLARCPEVVNPSGGADV